MNPINAYSKWIISNENDEAMPTLDFNNLMTFWLDKMTDALLTSTIIRTVGSVVDKFCG